MSTLTIEENKHPTMCYLEDVIATTAEVTTSAMETTTAEVDTAGGGLFFALLVALFFLLVLVVLCCCYRKCKRMLRRRRRRSAKKKETKNKSKVLKVKKPKGDNQKQEEQDRITSIKFYDEMKVVDEIEGILKSNGKQNDEDRKVNGNANKVTFDTSLRSIPDSEIPLKV